MVESLATDKGEVVCNCTANTVWTQVFFVHAGLSFARHGKIDSATFSHEKYSRNYDRTNEHEVFSFFLLSPYTERKWRLGETRGRRFLNVAHLYKYGVNEHTMAVIRLPGLNFCLNNIDRAFRQSCATLLIDFGRPLIQQFYQRSRTFSLIIPFRPSHRSSNSWYISFYALTVL